MKYEAQCFSSAASAPGVESKVHWSCAEAKAPVKMVLLSIHFSSTSQLPMLMPCRYAGLVVLLVVELDILGGEFGPTDGMGDTLSEVEGLAVVEDTVEGAAVAEGSTNTGVTLAEADTDEAVDTTAFGLAKVAVVTACARCDERRDASAGGM